MPLHFAEQDIASGFERFIRNANQSGFVLGRTSTIYVPVSTRTGVLFCASRRKLEQGLQPALRTHSRVVSAMRTEPAEERIVAGRHALSHDRDPQPGNRGVLRRSCCVKTIAVIGSCFAKGILLMRGPKMRGKLLNKLRR